jgi:hypothetical protein
MMKPAICFLAFIITSAVCAKDLATDPLVDASTDGISALIRAKLLKAPVPKATLAGDLEDQSFWDDNEALIQDALEEYGKLHDQIYDFNTSFQDKYMDPNLTNALRNQDLSMLSGIMNETDAPGVYATQIFNSKFSQDFLEEIRHYESSGIPLRRPNSMNRYGVILSMIGFDRLINNIVTEVLTPLARLQFGDIAAPADLKEAYAFTVRYKPGMDRNLTEHTDHSTITVNICLETTSTEKVLYFKNQKYFLNDTDSEVDVPNFVSMSTPGVALIHLGQHTHGVREVHGERTQLVIWMSGEYGYVRIAPYDESEIVPHNWSARNKAFLSDNEL